MPDRFSEQSPADLMRSSRLSSRCFRDEDGMPDGEYLPVVADEPEDYEAPAQPLCAVGSGIVDQDWPTIGEYSDALKAHKLICGFCRGEVSIRPIQSERAASKRTGKAA